MTNMTCKKEIIKFFLVVTLSYIDYHDDFVMAKYA